jgi:hypothetical protein
MAAHAHTHSGADVPERTLDNGAAAACAQVDSAFGQLRQQIESALRGSLKRAEIKVANLRRQMASTAEAASSQHLADLLQANVYRFGDPLMSVGIVWICACLCACVCVRVAGWVSGCVYLFCACVSIPQSSGPEWCQICIT